jgi:hypothetical protein
VDVGVGCHDADLPGHALARIDLHHLELHGVHGLAHQEEVPLLHRPVRLCEVGLQVHLEQVAGDALDGVVKRQHVDALGVGHVLGLVHRHDVAEAHTQVLAHDLQRRRKTSTFGTDGGQQQRSPTLPKGDA